MASVLLQNHHDYAIVAKVHHRAMPPNTVSETIALIKQFALEEFDRAIEKQQLHYHNRWHISVVQQRASRILAMVAPYWEELTSLASPINNLTQAEQLLNLCVISHDVVQIFVPCPQPHCSRKRESGTSEQATFELLKNYIHQLNHQVASAGQLQAQFSDQHLALLQSAILGTTCTYAAEEIAIFQPALYPPQGPPDIITQILALADIGAFGMDGIPLYNQEGSLLFLEENPDIIPFIQSQTTDRLLHENPALAENFRLRLLKRARWQVSFARSRLSRTPQELAGLPDKVINVLGQEAFPYLNQETLAQLEEQTPTADSSTLQQLLNFFQLDHYLAHPPQYLTTV